jgi:hypothetical protein
MLHSYPHKHIYTSSTGRRFIICLSDPVAWNPPVRPGTYRAYVCFPAAIFGHGDTVDEALSQAKATIECLEGDWRLDKMYSVGLFDSENKDLLIEHGIIYG